MHLRNPIHELAGSIVLLYRFSLLHGIILQVYAVLGLLVPNLLHAFLRHLALSLVFRLMGRVRH